MQAQTTSLPGKKETAEYIRGKVLSLTTKDGHNGYADASFIESDCIFSTLHEDKDTIDINLSNLDANAISWDIFDPSPDEAPGRKAKLLRLTISSADGKIARKCSSGCNEKVARFLFKLDSIENVEEFKKKMSKAVKHLITLCGGKKEVKDPFGN